MNKLISTGVCNFIKGQIAALRILIVFIPVVLAGCRSDPALSIINGSFSQWKDGRLTGWQVPLLAATTKVLLLNDTAVQFSQSIPGRSKMWQRISVLPERLYVIEGYIESYEGKDWNVGLWVEGKELLGYHILEKNAFDGSTQVKIKFQADRHYVDIKLGFQKFGPANAIFNNFTISESSGYIGLESDLTNQVKKIVSLAPFDSLNLHHNVLLLTAYINSLLITPLNKYYNFKGSAEERERYITHAQLLRDSLKQYYQVSMPTSYLQSYLALPIKETANAYCVKSSNSAHDILGEFGIMTRQIHFYNKEDIPIHQCFEYWNPYKESWIIVDPFYGISYVNSSKELIGFEELNAMIKQNRLTVNNIVHLDIQEFYFNLEELQSGWHRIKPGKSGSDRLTLF